MSFVHSTVSWHLNSHSVPCPRWEAKRGSLPRMFNSGTCVTPVSGPADLGGWTANLQKSHGTGAAAEYDDRLGHRHTRLPERATRPRTGHHDCDVEKDQQSQVRHKSSKKVLEANDSEGLACCGWLQLYIYIYHSCTQMFNHLVALSCGSEGSAPSRVAWSRKCLGLPCWDG